MKRLSYTLALVGALVALLLGSYYGFGNVIAALIAGLAGYFIATAAVFWLVSLLGICAILSTMLIDPKEINHKLARGFRQDQTDDGDQPSGFKMLLSCRPLLVFVAAILVHLLRIFFTGAFRKPRDINYYIGLTLLTLAILEGFMGYSLPGDLLSGMGLAIAYGVTLSIPIVGANLAFLLWGGEFPGSASFEPRLFILHVFVLPAVIGALIGAHLAIIMRQKHSQFRGRGRRENNVIGTPMWPADPTGSTPPWWCIWMSKTKPLNCIWVRC